MSQIEVLEFLKKNPGKWFNSTKVAESLGVRLNVVNTGVRKLERFKYIELRKIGRWNGYEFRYRE